MEEKEDIIRIDFKSLFFVIWSNKWWIILVTTVFTTVGGIYAFTAKEEFISEGKLLPEISSGQETGLGSLANLVGIGGVELGLNKDTDAIRPDLYPDILKSNPFFLNLFKQKFVNRLGDSTTFESFYIQNIEGDGDVKKDFLRIYKGRPTGVLVLNRQLEVRIEDLSKRIKGSIDKRSGIITISTKLPDPVVAAEATKFAINYLTEYVTAYRTEKINREVDFLGRKVSKAKGEYYQDQIRKASYSDGNSLSTIRIQQYDIQRERIDSDYKMSSGLYNELLKKYEEAKIKLHRQTPVFQILDPPTAPSLESEPKKVFIVLLFFLFGLLSSVIICLMVRGKSNFVISRG